MNPIRLATRNSPLALYQTQLVADLLEKHQVPSKPVAKTSEGDQRLDIKLSDHGGKGLFTKSIEKLLIDQDADLAVHSAKDMPSKLNESFMEYAYLAREVSSDLIIFSEKTFEQKVLPHLGSTNSTNKTLRKSDYSIFDGMTLATSSPRREAMAKHLFKNIKVVPIRGNIQTRMIKLEESTEIDGLFMAKAAAVRLGIDKNFVELAKDDFVPCGGQGAVLVESLKSYKSDYQKILNCPTTFAAVSLERSILFALGASCTSPIGAHAWKSDHHWHLNFFISDHRSFVTKTFEADSTDDLFDLWKKSYNSDSKISEICQKLELKTSF